MKMCLSDTRWDFDTWKAKTIRTPRAFCFDRPKRKLRQLCLHIRGAEERKIEVHNAFRLSCELFRHQRLPASDRSLIDMTLRFAVNVRACSREIIAFAKLS